MECLICKGDLLNNEEIKTCEECETDFHSECWLENGGCGTPGCVNLPKLENKKESAKKICPACGETINMSELVCPLCNERFETIAPLTPDELKGVSKNNSKEKIEGKNIVISILIFGLLGFTAPFTLILGGIWYHQKKNYLREASPLYNILTIVGLSISLFYSFIIMIGIFSK